MALAEAGVPSEGEVLAIQSQRVLTTYIYIYIYIKYININIYIYIYVRLTVVLTLVRSQMAQNWISIGKK